MEHVQGAPTDRPFWSAAVVPAALCVLGGLIVPLTQLPASFLGCLLGPAALLAVPAGLFGALLGKGIDLTDGDGDGTATAWTGGGFVVGAIVATMAFPPTRTPGAPALAVAGAFGGLGLALGSVRSWAGAGALAPLVGAGFALAMSCAAPAVSIGGG